MSDKVKRWEPDFDGIMCERNGGDYVLASDFDALHAEVIALREALGRIVNGEYDNAHSSKGAAIVSAEALAAARKAGGK